MHIDWLVHLLLEKVNLGEMECHNEAMVVSDRTFNASILLLPGEVAQVCLRGWLYRRAAS